MLKKVIGSAIVAGMVATSSIAASAEPFAFDRTASRVDGAEDAMAPAAILGILVGIGLTIYAVVEITDDSPVSP